MHNCKKSLALETQKTRKIYWLSWLHPLKEEYFLIWRWWGDQSFCTKFCCGSPAKAGAERLDLQIPIHLPQPQRWFSKLQLASTGYAMLFFNSTSTFGYSGAHVRHNCGQDWVCRLAAQTPQWHCLLWPQPGYVSVNGKSPIGNLARVSVINPKLAFVDDDIMAGQRRTTDFRAVDNVSRLSHALDRIQVELQRWEHLRRGLLSFVCI